MNNKDEFLERMENLQVPDVPPPSNQNTIKMAIMNAERSAALGVWLIVLPCYFLFCVFMYHYSQNAARAYFDKHLTWFEAMYQMVINMDKSSVIPFLGPVLLVLLPLICIVINALAITHVRVQNAGSDRFREFNISIKIKLWNILLILISLAIVFIFISYVMASRNQGPIRLY